MHSKKIDSIAKKMVMYDDATLMLFGVSFAEHLSDSQLAKFIGGVTNGLLRKGKWNQELGNAWLSLKTAAEKEKPECSELHPGVQK